MPDISKLFTTKFSNMIVILQSFVLLYILILEPDSCQCYRDWKHNYIKIFSLFIIIYHIFRISVVFEFKPYYIKHFMVIYIGITLLYIINAYAVYNYVNVLNEKECKCIKQHHELNQFMIYFKYILIFIAIGTFIISIKLLNNKYHLFI
jgi:hypothetical protein